MRGATVATATWDTPLGRLVVGVTERGLAAVDLADDEAPEGIVADLADALGVRPVRDAARTTPARRAIDAYLAGRTRAFDLELDWSLAPEGFGRRVLRATTRIPYGRVATYGEIAGRAGAPRGARAAGNALNRNPFLLVVPCHRVVPAAGGIGGYGGKEWRKAFLLRLEGHPV
ncbi:MAG: methylated-DNA--[protein]-cysteine S-methyltransferase [Actinomycetota bacterium]